MFVVEDEPSLEPLVDIYQIVLGTLVIDVILPPWHQRAQERAARASR